MTLAYHVLYFSQPKASIGKPTLPTTGTPNIQWLDMTAGAVHGRSNNCCTWKGSRPHVAPLVSVDAFKSGEAFGLAARSMVAETLTPKQGNKQLCPGPNRRAHRIQFRPPARGAYIQPIIEVKLSPSSLSSCLSHNNIRFCTGTRASNLACSLVSSRIARQKILVSGS